MTHCNPPMPLNVLLLNLIDQYDGDSFSTVIQLPEGTESDDASYLGSGTRKVKIYGIESLPYLQGVLQVWRFVPLGGTIVLQPVLWNPHDVTTYIDPASSAPWKFRVWAFAKSFQYLYEPPSTADLDRNNSSVEFDANPTAYQDPLLIARRGRDGVNATPDGAEASSTDISEIEWIGAGRTKPAGGRANPGVWPYYESNSADGLFLYESEIAIEETPGPVDMGISPSGASKVTARACISVDTKLPVSLQIGSETRIYQFGKPSQEDLTYPSEVAAEIEAWRAELTSATRPPSPP